MGLIALLQILENFFEINWSFKEKKKCFLEAIFCEDFHISWKYYRFYLFLFFEQKFSTGLSEQLYMCSK